MNRNDVIKFLKQQRDSHLYRAYIEDSKSHTDWLEAEAERIDDVIKWIEKEVAE